MDSGQHLGLIIYVLLPHYTFILFKSGTGEAHTVGAIQQSATGTTTGIFIINRVVISNDYLSQNVAFNPLTGGIFE